MNGKSRAQFDGLVNDVWSLRESGAMLITELGHGSDTKSFLTTCTFDKDTQQFVLHTPCLEATKVRQ